MMDLSRVRNYYIACGYTELYLGIDRLAPVVTQQYGSQLSEESLFLFCGRRTDRIKALYWTADRYLLLYKRLSNGRFQWPRSELELQLLESRQEKLTGDLPDGATVKTSKAAVGFQYCTKLFSLEKKYYDADEKSRKDYRQNVVLHLMEEYFAWLNTVHPEKGSKLEDAVRYSMKQKQQLMAFLDHGKVPISNTLAENTVRPFVMGRKNWLVCDSVKRAQSSAIAYSLVETAKVNGLEPYKYVRYILEELPCLEKSPAHTDLDTLMPWDPYILQQCSIGKAKKTSE